ncbi:DUF3263 domain-containing protein [Leifsonia sp. NPDC102414]|uniref:DUF3263 domain-containing protein n=1 Tax=unclassified Leifsonia TaxID=2663824 RepID=UPI000B204C70|nr:DUF3263 domain-containing protein [Leifsonia sp. Root227]
MPTPRERLLLLFEAEHPEAADRAAKDEAIRRTFGLDPEQYRAIVAELVRAEHRDAA